MTASRSPDPVHVARSAVAVAARRGRDQTAARQQLKEAKLIRWVNEALETAPPLTDEQRYRVAMLLLGGEAR